MKQNILTEFVKEFYWTVPFLLFLAGYQTFNLFYKTHVIQTPHLVGKTVQESLAVLAQSKMNVRLITQKEDPDLPEGTVLTQIPAPGQKIKPHQTVFIVASKHPETMNTPQLRGKFHDEVVNYLKSEKIRHKTFFIETSRPEGLCLAQIPQAGQPLENDGITLYFATDRNASVLFPDLKGVTVQEAQEFLAQYNITPSVFHLRAHSDNHDCSDCVIKEQKPLAGSFVNLKKPFSVQLKT